MDPENFLPKPIPRPRERFPQISGENSALGEEWSPVTAADFLENSDRGFFPFYILEI